MGKVEERKKDLWQNIVGMSSYQCLTTTVDDTSQATGKVYMRAREASASEGRASGGALMKRALAREVLY